MADSDQVARKRGRRDFEGDDVLAAWRERLTRSGRKGDGPAHGNESNALQILAHSSKLHDPFHYDEFRNQVLIWDGEQWRLLEDDDLTWVLAYVQRIFQVPTMPWAVLSRAIEKQARDEAISHAALT